MYKVVRKQEAGVRKVADNKTAFNYITKYISTNVSMAVIEAEDCHQKETIKYNRIYFVISGKLVLIFDDKSVILLEGDSCYIDKDTNYELEGTFKTVIINQPAFGM